MKKLLSFLLVVSMILSLGVSAFAMPRVLGVDILRTQFDHGEGPADEKGLNIDYSYYSPIDGADYNKYPLVIFMPGAFEGVKESMELYENQFAMWACDEFQKQFQNAGKAFLMIARSPEDVNLTYNWSHERLAEPMKLALLDFVEKHPNVDTGRIYGIGWCLGAKGIINLEKAAPGTFAFMSLMVPSFEITAEDAEIIKDTNVLLTGSTNDTLGLFSTFVEPSWANIKSNASTGKLRAFTTYTKAKNTTLAIAHNVWDDASYNWDYKPKSAYAKTTVDSSGKKVEIDSYIDFISSFAKDGWDGGEYVPPKGFKLICTCDCHNYSKIQLSLIKIANKFIELIAKILLTDAYVSCSCVQCSDGTCENNECSSFEDAEQVSEPVDMPIISG